MEERISKGDGEKDNDDRDDTFAEHEFANETQAYSLRAILWSSNSRNDNVVTVPLQTAVNKTMQ